MRLILLLVVLFGCFYLNAALHTVYVANIYPNYEEYVVINDFATDNFAIGNFNVGTLDVNSAQGVNILTSSSITLKGASASLGGSTVSVSSSSPGSSVNINAAATLDILGNSATFSSTNGGVNLQALTNFELISTGDLSGNYYDSYSLDGTLLNFQASKGGTQFLSHANFSSQATTTFAEAGNLVLFNATEFFVSANLAIDIFTSEFSVDVDSFTLTALRNNILLQTGTLLDIGGLNVNIDARDLFTISSLQSQVVLASLDDGSYNAANTFTIYSDNGINFSADNGDLSIFAEDSLSIYANEGVTIQSTSAVTFNILSLNLTATGISVAVETTDGDINYSSNNSTSTAFTSEDVYAEGDLTFSSFGALTVNSDAGIFINADRGVLSLATSPTQASNALFKFTSFFNTILSGTSVTLTPNTIFFNAGENFRIATNEEDRGSEINIATSSTFSANANLFLLSGGDVEVDAQTLTLQSNTDITFTAIDSPSSSIFFNTYNQSEIATHDIAFNGGQYIISADGIIDFTSDSYFTVNTLENLDLVGYNNINFNVFSNTTIDTTLDANYISDGIQFGVSILEFVQINAGYVDGTAAGFIDTTTTQNITFVGTNINFEADDELLFDLDLGYFVLDASRFTILSGDQQYLFAGVSFISTNTLLQSPPDQDFILSTQALTVNGDTTLGARSFSSTSNSLSFSISTSIYFSTTNMDSISLSSTVSTLFESGSFYANTDQDLFLTANNGTITIGNTETEYDASGDITHTASNSVKLTTDDLYVSAEDFSSYSTGSTFILSSREDLFAANINYISLGGGVTDFANAAFFTGGPDQSQLTFNSGITNNFFAHDSMTLTAQNFQISGNLTENANQDIEYKSNNTLVFFGSEFDITAFGSVTLNTPQVLTLEAAVINLISQEILQLSSQDGISLIAGLDKTLSFSQNSVLGSFTIEADDLLIRSNNVLDVYSNKWSHTANGVDSFGNSILIQTSASSAGISIDTTTVYSNATDNIRFVVDDVANQGGEDIDITGSGTYHVTAIGGSDNPVNPVPLLTDSLSSGIFFYASGSEYDPILGYEVGMLFRTEGDKPSPDGTISITSALDVFYNSNLYNEITSFDDVVLFIAEEGLAAYTIGGDYDMESQRSNSFFTSDLGNIDIIIGATTQIQSSSTTKSISNTGTFLEAALAFEVIADRGGVFFNLVGSSDIMKTTATSIDLEGASNGLFQYASDTYSATTIDLFAFSTSTFQGTTESVTAAHNMYYESSLNNDITITSTTSSSVTATAGDIILTAGLDHTFTALTDITYTATAKDVTFYSAGSFQYIAQDNLKLLSAANQIYVGQQYAYFESLGTISVGDGITWFPIVTIYAGGDTLNAGVNITAIADFDFATKANNNVVGRSFLSTTDLTSDITAGGSILLQSTGTNGIGKDVTFQAGESLDITSFGNLILNAKTLKFEYNDLDFTTNSNFLLTAIKGIAISGSSFSTNSLSHTIQSKAGLTVDANSNVTFAAGTSLSFVSKTTSIWSALSQIELFAGTSLLVTSTGTNSPITFETKNERSFIVLQAAVDLSYTAGSDIATNVEDGFTALSLGDISFIVGDEFSSTNGGDITISAVTLFTIDASDPSSTGSDIEFTSTGIFDGYIGNSLIVSVGGDLYFEPDVDLSFNGGSISSDVHSNFFDIVVKNSIDLTTGNNFNFNANRVLFSGATYYADSLNVNPENGDGILLSTTGTYSNIEVGAYAGSILISAVGDIDILSDNAVTLQAAGSVQLISKGKEGISFQTNIIPTPILAVSRDGLDLYAENLLTLQSFGYDTASGYIDLFATGYANLGEYNPIINGTFGIGFFSADSSIDVIASDSSFRMDNLRHFIASPNVNGTLLLQSFGQSIDGYGINVESTIIAVQAELDVAFEAVNINFFDYGISLYNYDYGYIYPQKTSINRPTIASPKDQTYVSYGHNEKGNAIELISSTPNSQILFETSYVNLYSGGSTLVQGELNTHISSVVQTYIVSATSVVLQGDGLNVDEGIYLTTRDLPDPITGLGSNIEFNSNIDSYILSAGRIITEAIENIYFFTGTGGNIDIVFAEGTVFQSNAGNFDIASTTTFIGSSSVMTLDAATYWKGVGNQVVFYALGNTDGIGNVVIGDPSHDFGGTFNDAPVLGVGNFNIYIDAPTVYLDSNNINVANNVELLLPVYTALPACVAADFGRTFLLTEANVDYICQCLNQYETFSFPDGNIFTGNQCFPFKDEAGYNY